MSEKLKELRERSQKRKKLLAQTLGVSSVSELRHALGATVDVLPKKQASTEYTADGNEKPTQKETDSLVYTDSSTFLKGTQSSNPHNDYCQHFVDTGQRPQNFIRDVGLADRFEEYPKLRELIKLKDELIARTATPPMYLKCDLKTFDLKSMGSKFDVVLVEPPLGAGWRWRDVLALELHHIAQPRSFVFLWCGSSEGAYALLYDLKSMGSKFDVVLVEPPLGAGWRWRDVLALELHHIAQPRSFVFLWCGSSEGAYALLYDLKSMGSKFDVVLVEPPLGAGWRWRDVLALELHHIAQPRSFVFLWCGSSAGLDMGRECLKKWGFRRCEDICWIKTNIKNPGHSKNLEHNAVFQRTKEHCLMGIKGTVRRSVDGDFIHANVDIDLIISEDPEFGSTEKPIEIFHIMEHFCLGRRRVHLFGKDSTIRPGWVTIGHELTNSNFNAELYASYFTEGRETTGCTERIEALRPKSPPNTSKGARPRGRGGFRGRGRGRGAI